MTDRLVSVNDTFDLPADVSTKLAARVQEPTSIIGAALKTAYVRNKPVTSQRPMEATKQVVSGRGVVGMADNGNTLLGWNTFGLAQSDNAGATWIGRNVPADVASSSASVGKASALKFKGSWYLQALKISDGLPGIFRAAPVAGAGSFTWSASLLNGAAGSTVFSTAFDCDDQYIYWGEYGDAVGGPSVYRSADGTTWTRVLGPGGMAGGRHVHGIAADPYNPGHVYLALGDATSTTYMARSLDYGATWAALPGALGTSQAYQSCQISFDADFIYYAPDTTAGMSMLKVDRATLTPRWGGRQTHRNLAVPGGLPSRKVTDLVTTSGSPVVTSASASFTAADVGSRIRSFGQNFIPIDAYIKSVDSATQVTLYVNATGTSSGLTGVLGGEAWGVMCYYGAVDPATGIYYFVSINGAAGGNVDGLFAYFPDGTITLLNILNTSPDARMFIDNTHGVLWVQGFSHPLLSI